MRTLLLLIILFLHSFVAHAEPLPPSEVFHLSVTKQDPNTFILTWDIKKDYFLYSDRIKMIPEKQSNIQIGTIHFPPASTKTDKQGKSYTIYRNQVSIPVSILGSTPGESILRVRYQGCSDDGFCYPPEMADIKVTIDNQLALSAISLESKTSIETLPDTVPEGDLSQVFKTHNWAMTLVIFFGFGLLLSFTPCILPMVPVLSGIIVGHGREVTTRKAFFLSLSYVLSMSITYALIGAVVALLGANLQVNLQTPWAIGFLSLLYVILALSMFGFYEFKLPASWQNKISGSSTAGRGGHYMGAALMGCLSTLILSPCVTAPLIGVLTYIAQTGNIVLGSITLFTLSLGMGTPLLLIGTSAGKWLPETGSWMTAVKAFFGVLLLGVAIYLLDRIIPALASMFLWASLLIFSGIYCGALSQALTHIEKFCQGIGIILLGYGFFILMGASMGSTNPLHPLAPIQSNTNTNRSAALSKKSSSLEKIKKQIADAKGKPIILDFYADWCASCKVMEATTFKDSQVQQDLNEFVVIKVDVTANNQQDRAVMNYFKVIAPPTFIFFNAQGEELNHLKLVGEISTYDFLRTLNQVQKSKIETI